MYYIYTINMKNMTKTRYRVYSLGQGIKESNDYFTSLADAKKYMKSHYNFMIEMGASLFTLSKEESDNDFDDIDTTGINTRTTIINL